MTAVLAHYAKNKFEEVPQITKRGTATNAAVFRDLLVIGARERGTACFRVGDYKLAWRWYRRAHNMMRKSPDLPAPSCALLAGLLNNRSIAALKLAKTYDAL